MPRCFFVLLSGLVICTNLLPAQNQRVVDSLHSVLQCQSEGDRFPALYDLAFEYIDKDKGKALEYIEQAADAALVSGDSLWIVKSIRVRGQLLYASGRPNEALLVLQKLTECANLIRFGKEYFEVMNTLGTCHLFMSQFDKSLEVHFKMLQESKRAKSFRYQSVALANIGLVYYKLKSYQKAADYMRQGLVKMDGLQTGTHKFLLNLGLCYAHLADFDNARDYVERSMDISHGASKGYNRKHAKYILGYIHYANGKLTAAKLAFLESLRMAREQNDVRIELDNIYLLAKISIHANQLHQAKNYLHEAEKIIRSGTPFNLEKLKVFEQLSQLYLALKSFERAAFYQSEYIQLKDSLYNETVTASLMNIESQYLESENRAKIAEQAQIIQLNQEVMKRQRQLNVLYAAVALLTSVIVVFLYRNYRKKRVLNAFLRKKVYERTRELEDSRRDLEKKAWQQEHVLYRVSSGVSGRLATMKGLCITAQQEIMDPVARRYVDRIEEASSKLEQFLHVELRKEESLKTI